MSPSIIVSTNEINAAGGNFGVTGTAFIPAVTDQAPISGPSYTLCRSINDFTTYFGARSSTSNVAFDWLDEFFHDGGQRAYVTRDDGGTGTAATLSLSDAVPHPTVVVTASPGVNGNGLYVVVTNGTAVTFTATTATSTALTAISSFANLGVGTKITGTGIAANTYVTSINVPAASAVLSNATTASATGVVITPATFTLTVQDVNANVFDAHGPYYATSQLYADLTSATVLFTQSAGGGFTANIPAALTTTALTGGLNSTGRTVSTAVTALANFPSSLGPGTVAIPAYANSTAWVGILAHAAANNRFGALDTPDNANSANVISNFGTIAANGSYGVCVTGSLTLPPILAGANRTTAASAGVAALRAQVSITSNQNQAPCVPRYSLKYPIAFTQYFGVGGSYGQTDVNSMSAAGINCWAIYGGASGLFGFVSPVLLTQDIIFWQATAATERMSLVVDGTNAITPFLFAVLDGQGATLTAAQTALKAVLNNHFINNALYGDNASDAGVVNMGAPINTPATLAAGQLNANLQVRISPYANTINESITTVPITTVPV